MRRCACPCNQPLVGRSANTLYIDHRHAQRAYRARVKKRLEAAGLPTSLSLASVEASSSTTRSNGDGHAGRNGAKKRRSGVQVSYRKAVEVVATYMAMIPPEVREQWRATEPTPSDEDLRMAGEVVARHLSPRARAQVEQQRQEAA